MKIITWIFICVLAIPALANAQTTNNNFNTSAAGECQKQYAATVAAIALGSSAGDIDVVVGYPCKYTPATENGILGFTINADGPQLLAGGVAGTSYTVSRTYTGCTVSGTDAANADVSALTDHYAFWSFFTYNAGSMSCLATIILTVVVATTATVHFRISLEIFKADNYVIQYGCIDSATTPLAFNPNTNICNVPRIDNQNRICDDSSFNTTCNQLQMNVDNKNRLCAASDYNTTCTTPTINAAITGTLTATLAGTIHNVIDSWPAVSGALTISDDANGWAIHQDALTGTLGLNIGSWPALAVHQDPLSGSIKVCGQTGVCGPLEIAPLLAQISGNLTLMGVDVNTTIGNQSVQFPSTIHICGRDLGNASCEGVGVNANGTAGTIFDPGLILPLILFILVIIWAEITKEPLLYVLAILLGIIAAVGTWVGVDPTFRTGLVVVIIYLIWRLFQTRRDTKED